MTVESVPRRVKGARRSNENARRHAREPIFESGSLGYATVLSTYSTYLVFSKVLLLSTLVLGVIAARTSVEQLGR